MAGAWRKFFSIVSFNLMIVGVCKSDDGVTKKCYKVEKLIDGLYNPLAVEFLMGKQQQQQMLIAEHRGVIRLFDLNESSIGTFLDLTDRVLTTSEPMDERGLLGLALDPHFTTNNYFYVFYSTSSLSPSLFDHDSVISRFQATRNGNDRKGIKKSELEIMRIQQPGPRQNGGQIFFADDGHLYITTGDGGDRQNSRFRKDSLLGKILRVSVSNSKVSQRYTIPDDNPFVNDPNASPEIYAYGFRNPWRCTVDYANERSKAATILCGDLGEPERNVEDLNVIHSGGRYGWLDDPTAPCHTVEQCERETVREGDYLPMHTYQREEGQAIIGGIVYHGRKFPKLNNKYIYGDYIHGSFHTLTMDSIGEWKVDDLCLMYPDDSKDTGSRRHVLGIAMMGQDDIVFMTNTKMSNNEPTGVVYKLKVELTRNAGRKPDTTTILFIMLFAFLIYY